MNQANLSGKTILIVEDEDDIRYMLSILLEMQGCLVSHAANGREALAHLRSQTRPQLIMLDLMMPVMDGREFRMQQQDDPALAAIPVVICSASCDGAATAAALKVSGYLQKPVDPDQLLAMIGRVS